MLPQEKYVTETHFGVHLGKSTPTSVHPISTRENNFMTMCTKMVDFRCRPWTVWYHWCLIFWLSIIDFAFCIGHQICNNYAITIWFHTNHLVSLLWCLSLKNSVKGVTVCWQHSDMLSVSPQHSNHVAHLFVFYAGARGQSSLWIFNCIWQTDAVCTNSAGHIYVSLK